MALTDDQLQLIASGEHGDPHRVLGRHGGVVRAYRPDAIAMRVITGPAIQSKVHGHDQGASGRHLRGSDRQGRPPLPAGGGLSARWSASSPTAFDDPYGSWPTIGELDLHLFGEGRHRRLWEVLGAHPRVHDGLAGVSFAVWAPNARAVRVVGDWNFWDGRRAPHAVARFVGRVGAVHSGRGDRGPLQVRAGDRRRDG